MRRFAVAQRRQNVPKAEERSDDAHDAVLSEGLCPIIATSCRGHGRPRLRISL